MFFFISLLTIYPAPLKTLGSLINSIIICKVLHLPLKYRAYFYKILIKSDSFVLEGGV